MDSKLFWGLLIVLIGVSIIINHVFKVDFPLFKVIIALIIIYVGIRILIGSFNFTKASDDQTAIFSNRHNAPEMIDRKEEFSSIFGSSTLDLRQTTFSEPVTKLEVNAIFGSVKVFVPDNVQLQVKGSAVFGTVKNKDRELNGIGDQKFPGSEASGNLVLKINASAVFGSVTIE